MYINILIGIILFFIGYLSHTVFTKSSKRDGELNIILENEDEIAKKGLELKLYRNLDELKETDYILLNVNILEGIQSDYYEEGYDTYDIK